MVMLPIALAYGVLSRLGPVAGVYCAIAVGFFAAVFGGTRSQISGPTGPMTLVAVLILSIEGITAGEIFTIVILAGLIQVLLAAVRSGQLVHYVPEPIISGFMTGIGIFVILLQIAPFMGAPVVLGEITKVIGSLPDTMENASPKAMIVAVVTLLTGVLWPKRLRKYFPPPLAAMVIGSTLALFWLSDLPTVDKVPTIGLPEWQLPMLSLALVGYLAPALRLALVGSVDSLMNARMVDRLTNARHRPNRELIAQGIGNVASGLIGGLPGSANTASTVANIQSGGGRIAGAFCALILLALTLGLGDFVNRIPIAVLAGILVKVGWDLIDWSYLLPHARRIRRKYLLLLLTIFNAVLTATLAMWIDPFVAMAAGMIIPLMATWRRQQHFPWITTWRQEHYELSLMILAVVLTVFADLLATAVVGLIFSLTPDSPRTVSASATLCPSVGCAK